MVSDRAFMFHIFRVSILGQDTSEPQPVTGEIHERQIM